MPKTFYEDQKVIWEITFYSDQKKKFPVDPDTIEFHLKKPDGTTDEAIPAANGEVGSGKWKAEYVLDQYGTWEWRWFTDDPRIVAQGEIWVVKDNVDD